MGGNTAYAFPDASDDYLKIPGESLKPERWRIFHSAYIRTMGNNIFSIKLNLWLLTILIQLIFLSLNSFLLPHSRAIKIYQVNKKNLPVSAIDSKGNDVLSFHYSKRMMFTFQILNLEKYQGVTEMQDLILDPGKTGQSGKLYLFMNGWIFPTDASINVALSQSISTEGISSFNPGINKKGEWETVIDNVGFPMGKDKTVIAGSLRQISNSRPSV